MAYKVNSLEEMPNALSYLIESVEALQSKVNALQNKQASNSPKWMDIDELCAYLPSHPAKQTVYGWVSAKQIPVHKINKALAFCIKATGLPLVDMSGSDVARSCFLPHDPQAYINPKYKDDVEENIFRPRLGECPF